MILTKNNIIYFGAALIVGGLLAFGIASMTYQPVPLQVAENPYPASTPPPPDIETLSPQYVPGSYAEENSDTSGDPYAPASPPVVVTTVPLPTITPTPTEVTNGAKKCSPVSQSFGSVVPVAIIAVGMLMVIIGDICGPGEPSINVGSRNTTQNRVLSYIPSSGVIPLLIGVGGILMVIYGIAIIVGSLTASPMCVP